MKSPSDLLKEMTALRRAVADEGEALYRSWHPAIARRRFRVSGQNFAHYLVLRRRDLRDLQRQLMPYGLSSLGRLESRVLASLDAVIGALARIAGEGDPAFPPATAFFQGERLLQAHTTSLLGPAGDRKRRARIMVTLPAEAAGDPDYLTALVKAGANSLRINCAHDSAEVWSAMVANARAAEKATGRRVAIVMDLGGPKCRIATVRRSGGSGLLERGDSFVIATEATKAPGDGQLLVTCTIPAAVGRLRRGDPVFVNDGKLGGEVEAVEPGRVEVRVLYAPAGGTKPKPDQGLNFPGTELGLSALSDTDRHDLDVVARLADIIGYSFVQSSGDIRELQAELAARRPDDWQKIGLIAKIETPLAVHNLPEIIVEAGSRQPFGVMIARGDLAVELGFERLAEMQEEILWLCEAAHTPVVWATQVLESFVKKGMPTRGDMTDAAMSARADCVMLNKGPHVLEAVGMLSRLLGRMAQNQSKKTPKLRALRSWRRPAPLPGDLFRGEIG